MSTVKKQMAKYRQDVVGVNCLRILTEKNVIVSDKVKEI